MHIGGTNGKGSTAAIVAHILQASGSRVGLYTSPHLVDFRERIRVNGTSISESQVIELTQHIQSLTPIALTFFEFTTAMAFQYFADERVDIAVIEVGMGGRFDATNVLSPLGVVITTIAHDHERYLGHTLSEIAFEKAGIIKQGTPVILGEMPTEAEDVIRGVATDIHAPCYTLGSEFHVIPDSSDRFDYHGIDKKYSEFSCSLQGRHQMRNAGCALALLERVGMKRLKVQESVIGLALSQVVWPGRVEILEEHPRLVIDGAHNPAAAKVLIDALTPMLQGDSDAQLLVILGMMQDKDRSHFMKVVCPFIKHLILTEVSVLRTATVDELKQSAPDGSYTLHESAHPTEALTIAKRLAKPCDVICITGSLFLAGEVRSLMRGSQQSSC